MKKTVRIAVLPFVRSTYEVREGERKFREQIEKLSGLPQVQWYFSPTVYEEVSELQSGMKAITEFNPDGIILLSATFHLGNLALHTAKYFNCPFLIWAFPEPPYNGGRVRLNSLVGAHLDLSNLYKIGKKWNNFLFGECGKGDFDRDLQQWLDTVRIKAMFKAAKILKLGPHARTFNNLDFFEPALSGELGVSCEEVALNDVFNRAEHVVDYEGELQSLRQKYSAGAQMDDERTRKVARLAVALKSYQKENVSALTIRCWPEFAANYGISPCAAMSFSMPDSIPMACEGDVLGALSMLAVDSIGCNEYFLSDISQIFPEENALLFWHCGVSPYSLWDGKSNRKLDTYFAGGKGVTAGFVLKPGTVSIFRIDYTSEGWRVFLAEGEAIETAEELLGTYVKVKVRNSTEFMKNLMENGFPHHVVMAYGQHVAVVESFAKNMGWKIYR